MAPSGDRTRTYPLHGFVKFPITLAFIFSLILLLPKSGGSVMIGSKPPACENKCMKCRPCIASLVIPNHNHPRKTKNLNLSSSRVVDDSYYLLSWRCRCRNKVFQP